LLELLTRDIYRYDIKANIKFSFTTKSFDAANNCVKSGINSVILNRKIILTTES